MLIGHHVHSVSFSGEKKRKASCAIIHGLKQPVLCQIDLPIDYKSNAGGK